MYIFANESDVMFFTTECTGGWVLVRLPHCGPCVVELHSLPIYSCHSQTLMLLWSYQEKSTFLLRSHIVISKMRFPDFSLKQICRYSCFRFSHIVTIDFLWNYSYNRFQIIIAYQHKLKIHTAVFAYFYCKLLVFVSYWVHSLCQLNRLSFSAEGWNPAWHLHCHLSLDWLIWGYIDPQGHTNALADHLWCKTDSLNDDVTSAQS